LRIVSNTSPIVALGHLGDLDLLRKIFDGVIISPHLQENILTHARE